MAGQSLVWPGGGGGPAWVPRLPSHPLCPIPPRPCGGCCLAHSCFGPASDGPSEPTIPTSPPCLGQLGGSQRPHLPHPQGQRAQRCRLSYRWCGSCGPRGSRCERPLARSQGWRDLAGPVRVLPRLQTQSPPARRPPPSCGPVGRGGRCCLVSGVVFPTDLGLATLRGRHWACGPHFWAGVGGQDGPWLPTDSRAVPCMGPSGQGTIATPPTPTWAPQGVTGGRLRCSGSRAEAGPPVGGRAVLGASAWRERSPHSQGRLSPGTRRGDSRLALALVSLVSLKFRLQVALLGRSPAVPSSG